MTHALPTMRFKMNRMVGEILGHKVQIEPYDPNYFFFKITSFEFIDNILKFSQIPFILILVKLISF
jgi:hypothetical protein